MKSIKTPYHFLLKTYHTVVDGVAFIPALLALLFGAAAMLMLYLESDGLSEWFKENLPLFVITSAETGRAILSTLIGALISLTVFSFTMVMVVLNQATNNFSPRLLPNLISETPHKIVLGNYLGVTTFCILTLISILPDSDYRTLPSFTVFVCVILGLYCMGLFVYFIDSISRRVQIDNIVSRLYLKTRDKIRAGMVPNPGFGQETIELNEYWHRLTTWRSGYIRFIDYEALAAVARDLDSPLYVAVPMGLYIPEGIPYVLVQRVPDEEQEQRIHKAITIDTNAPSEWFESGIKQLAEVAVKAMSPGINDPGTALKALDYLTDLLAQYMKVPALTSFRGPQGGLVCFAHLNFADLLRGIMEELRLYMKHDTLLVRKLIVMLGHLLQQDAASGDQGRQLHRELQALIEDANTSIANKLDRETISALVLQVRRKGRQGRV